MRQVTGRGARNPGPNPNASYKLRYTPSAQSPDRKGASFAITGAHLHKTWAAYGRCVQGAPPVWDPDFVSVSIDESKKKKRTRTRTERTEKVGSYREDVSCPRCLALPAASFFLSFWRCRGFECACRSSLVR